MWPYSNLLKIEVLCAWSVLYKNINANEIDSMRGKHYQELYPYYLLMKKIHLLEM